MTPTLRQFYILFIEEQDVNPLKWGANVSTFTTPTEIATVPIVIHESEITRILKTRVKVVKNDNIERPTIDQLVQDVVDEPLMIYTDIDQLKWIVVTANILNTKLVEVKPKPIGDTHDDE